MPFSTSYPCPEPDFYVKAVVDGQLFPAHQDALTSNSDVFRDMFLTCDANESPLTENYLELHENATMTATLLSLIHRQLEPPLILCTSDPANGLLPKVSYDQDTVIPFPILTGLFSLADKYALSEDIVETLKNHLLAHASTDPLQTYSYALNHGFTNIASKATQFFKPLPEYSRDEVKLFPSALAYHDIVQLQAFRIQSLKSILAEETLFPHGYGSCSQHRDTTQDLWRVTKTNLAAQIGHLTDVAGEMEIILESVPVKDCTTCSTACVASIDMLRYKCRRIPREIARLVSA